MVCFVLGSFDDCALDAVVLLYLVGVFCFRCLVRLCRFCEEYVVVVGWWGLLDIVRAGFALCYVLFICCDARFEMCDILLILRWIWFLLVLGLVWCL